jgi:hypothetical protein
MTNLDDERATFGVVRYVDRPWLSACRDCAPVVPAGDRLETGNCAALQKREQRLPVVRRAITQPETRRTRRRLSAERQPAQRGGRPPPRRFERRIEPANAAESRRERNLGKRHRRSVDELFREVQPARLKHRERRSAEMLKKEAPQVSRANAQAVRQRLDRKITCDGVVDQTPGASHGAIRSVPRGGAWRNLRPAAEARTKACFSRSCG